MIIHYTIAKGRHETPNDALKLTPLIRTSDVVSFEMAGATEKRAREVEEYFPTFYGAKREVQEQLRNLHKDPYYIQVRDIVINNRKAVIQAERFSLQRSLEIMKFPEKDDATKLREMRSLETMMVADYDSLKLVLDKANLRDQNIVENASSLLLDRIAELYPRLAEQDELNYLISMGYIHTPEVGLRELPNTTVDVIDLTGNPKPWELLLYQKIQDGSSYDGCQDDFARLFIKTFLKPILLQTDAMYDLSIWMIASMGVQEAADLHSRIMSNPSFDAGKAATHAFFEQHGIAIPTNRNETRDAMRKYVPKSLQ